MPGSEPSRSAIIPRIADANAWPALCFLAALALTVLPLALVDQLPIQDYPNHLARMHILASRGDSPALQRFYEIDWRPIGNLGMDLIVPPLAWAMPLEWAGRAFVAISFVLLAGGAMLLHRAVYGRIAVWPLLGFIFVYDRIVFLGF